MPSNNMGGSNPNAWSGNNSNNSRNLDMPNLQALGINPGGNQQNQGSNMNNPPMGMPSAVLYQVIVKTISDLKPSALGVGLNLNALPMNPAIVAAALNQWGSAMGGLLNGMQNQANNDQVSDL